MPDANTPIKFLPGLVSTGEEEFGSAFSPDGNHYFFSKRTNGKSRIYFTTHENGSWSKPSLLDLDTTYAVADPAFDQYGNLYFISTMPVDSSDTLRDYDIWRISPLNDGKWSLPENLGMINSDSNEFYVSFHANGDMYFASSRSGGMGSEDIYVSKWKDNEFGEPHNLGPSINTDKSEYDPGISFNGGLLVFASSGRDDSFGKADLYVAGVIPVDSVNWYPAVHLDSTFNINTSSREYCPYFTRDSRFFFFSSEGVVKWVDADALFQK